MSQVEWYYARDNRQMGPVSSAELKRLATFDELRPDDLVWREGMTEWAAARNVRGLFEEDGGAAAAVVAGVAASKAGEASAKPQDAGSAQPRRHPFDALLDTCRSHFNEHFIEATARIFQACGSYGLLAAIAVTAVFSVVASVQIKSHDAKFADGATWLSVLLSGVVALLALAVLQYVAGKSFSAVERLNRATAASLSSLAGVRLRRGLEHVSRRGRLA